MDGIGYAILYFYGLIILSVIGLTLLLLSVFVVKLKRIAGKVLLIIGIICLLPAGNFFVDMMQSSQAKYNRMGPFFQAIYDNNYKKANNMIMEGYNVNMCNLGTYPSTPLTFAIFNHGDIRMIRLLVENGANVNGDTINSNFPLNSAITRGNAEIVNYLLEQGADASLENRDWSQQPMYLATSYTRGEEVVKNLLKYGANADDANLLDAIRREDYEQIRCLLEHGANPSKKLGSESPLSIAEMIKNKDIIELLLQYGAVK